MEALFFSHILSLIVGADTSAQLVHGWLRDVGNDASIICCDGAVSICYFVGTGFCVPSFYLLSIFFPFVFYSVYFYFCQ